jgi:chromosome segregation ATPase
MQDPNDTPAATAAGDTVALLRDTAAMAPALKRLLVPRGASAEGWDDWRQRIEATADRLDAAERERELLAETARRLTDERDAARKTLSRATAAYIGSTDDIKRAERAAADAAREEARREKLAAETATRALEVWGNVLRRIVAAWERDGLADSRGRLAQHLPGLIAEARTLIGEGDR